MNNVRVPFALFAILAAAVIPLIAALLGASTFWAQALGITIGSLLLFLAIVPPTADKKRAAISWVGVAAIATLVAIALRHIW